MSFLLSVGKVFAVLIGIVKAAFIYKAGRDSVTVRQDMLDKAAAEELLKEVIHDKNIADGLSGDNLERLRQLLNERDTEDR